MSKSKLLISALAGLLLVYFTSWPGAADEPASGLATQKPNPFLLSMKALSDKRALNSSELEKLSDYIRKHPDDPDGHLLLAHAYNQLGMTGLYAEELEKSWRSSPGALLYLFAALRARALSDDHPSFDRLVDEAYRVYKNDASALSKLGKLFQDNDENTLAARFLGRSLELNKKNLKTLCDYCSSLLALNQYRELISAAGPLFSNEETRSLANLLSGTAWHKLNRPEKAVPLLAEAYREAPDRPEVAEAYVDALLSTGQRSQALQPALMALALQPPFSSHMTVLKAKVKPLIERASISGLEDGINQVCKAMLPGRSLAFFYFALGDLLDKSGRVWEACNCFNKGLSMDQSLGRAYMRLAHDLEILGGASDSVMELYKQAATRTPPEDKEVRAKYERMKVRIPAMDKDIAGKLKCVINNLRYKP